MMDQLPHEIEEILDELDNPEQQLTESYVADRIRKARGSQGEAEENEAARAEVIAFSFYVRGTPEDDSGHGYFGPMFSGTDAAGIDVVFPKRDAVPMEWIAYWQARSEHVRHPVLRARYADLVWDLSETSTGDRPNVSAAHNAVDGYLDAVEAKLIPHASDVESAMTRALILAMQINDGERVSRAKSIILAMDEADRGHRGFAYDVLLLRRKKVALTDSEEGEIISRQEQLLTDCERAASTASTEGNAAAQTDPFRVTTIAQRLASYYRRKDRPDDIRRVLDVCRQLVVATAKSASGLVASTWLEGLHGILQSYGLTAEAETVAVEIREAGATASREMKTVSHRMEIKQEHLDQLVESVLQGTVEQQCSLVGAHFLPRAGDLRKQVEDLARSFPLQNFIPQVVLDEHGRAVARVGGVDADPEGRMVLQMARNLVVVSPFLRHVLVTFRERTRIDALVSALMTSPLFDHGQAAILQTGLAAHAREDHITTLHVLIPQIERILRRLLELCQVSTYRPARRGGFMLKNLDDILREPAVEATFGPDFVLYARVVLTDQRGWNLRHDLAHGAMESGRMTSVTSDRVLHLLFVLGSVRRKQEAAEDGA